ncbi:hypothetical protein E5161_03875 [Cohnella pontilimi]|uniref:Copper amine oxidase n=1 Tax=Cohnella pontilimi TaxID=2564100 RepID=A0A4U0FJ75_9BACL|nr:hypothetical protein [Cohnella pontilimi]TJY44524.1 hypothetical protein E5161_03875 [Cohnella pontilimi]
MKKRMLLSLAMAVGLFGAGTAFAAQETVPISSLQPAVQLEKPQLYGVGGKLIFSDSPETFATPGGLYRGVADGEFRVFWHHQNASDTTFEIGAAITNTSSQTVRLYTKGRGVGTNYYVDVAGQDALVQFLNTQNTKVLVAELAPGQSYYITAPTPKDITNSGIVQFVASDKSGKPAQVTVTTLAYESKPKNPEKIAILPSDDHGRGTFPHFDRIGVIQYDTAQGNAYISVDAAAYGPWQDDMPGEYENGWSAVDNAPVINNGNYGVMYHFAVHVTNSHSDPRQVGVYLNPAGGYGHFALLWNKQLFQSDYLNYEQAWHITDFKVNPHGGLYSSQMSLTGGSAGPQVIYFTNQRR